MPILQIGMCRNLVTALSLTSSTYLTTVARGFCWLVSLDSSLRIEKGPVLHCFTSYSTTAGTMAFLTIIVVLVWPQDNFLAIFESGNGKLCSATKFVNRVSLRIFCICIHCKKVRHTSCGVLRFLQPGIFLCDRMLLQIMLASVIHFDVYHTHFAKGMFDTLSTFTYPQVLDRPFILKLACISFFSMVVASSFLP